MKIARWYKSESYQKIIAIGITFIIITSSLAVASITFSSDVSEIAETVEAGEYPTRPCNIRSIPTEIGDWVSFDYSSIGSPAEAHVTISDTSGITIVADFHGFWRSNCTVEGAEYDNLEMPGATSLRVPGNPRLPCLFEYVEIPHDIDVTIEVLSSSSNITSGYNITPASPPSIPLGIGESSNNESTLSTTIPITLDSSYSTNASYPGVPTNTEGESNNTALVMRGRRILGLSIYPVQYNPVTTEIEVYSQLIVKVKYSKPAQILPVPIQLHSAEFEIIFENILLNYDTCLVCSQQIGCGSESPPPPPGSVEGAEYLIITNETFRYQAQKLANWKDQKGVQSSVVIIEEEDPTTDDVKDIIDDVYDNWYPVPTYVLLFGDVEVIPANYDLQHRARIPAPGIIPGTTTAINVFEGSDYFGNKGYIASDLGYFNVDETGYFPDMVYSRISVDTVEQAEIIVNKILRYEQDPPADSRFYENTLSAGYFQDMNPRDTLEDLNNEFLYTLERIRHYLNDMYNVHVNYSTAYQHYNHRDTGWISPLIVQPNPNYLEDLYFQVLLMLDTGSSQLVSDSLNDVNNFGWIGGYVTPIHHIENGRYNITLNINDGRFFVLYLGHGGSKNMKYPTFRDYTTDDRDYEEGWHAPYYNTSFFGDLNNDDELPLVVSLSCNSGWFDGETDQDFLYLGTPVGTNAFSEYENECFAENITRLLGGGAIAAIASSRPAYSIIIKDMADGLTQAFWPGFLTSQNQPMYGMGTALLYSKLYAKRQNPIHSTCPYIYGTVLEPFDYCRVVSTSFEEFHLFGDPETQLLTERPPSLNVSYPYSVGTSDPQRFVVTVKNGYTDEVVSLAKVCIQQNNQVDPVYQVGYTNSRGQVIFDIDPSAELDHINVTVTKHNYRPHIGRMVVHDSLASLSLSHSSLMEGETVTITLTGFPTPAPIRIYIGDYLAVNHPTGFTQYSWEMPSGPNEFMNVWVVEPDGGFLDWSPVSVERIARISEEEGPDPYIYSQDDPSTWPDPMGPVVWDNPDIKIYRDGLEVSTITQDMVHQIEVTVHNRGTDTAIPTNVVLQYAPFGGGLSWEDVGTYDVNPAHGGTDTAYFTIETPIPHSACLRVILENIAELPVNTINNIGLENVDVIELASPGEGILLVGNPTESTDYVYIKVKQQGNHIDVWNATIIGYSSQAIDEGLNESIILNVNPMTAIGRDEWRLFTIEIYVNGVRKGGMVFNATALGVAGDGLLLLLAIGGAAVVVAIAVVYIIKKKQNGNTNPRTPNTDLTDT